MIIKAISINRSYAVRGENLGADFESHVIDFADMPMASIQFLWGDVTGTLDGSFKIYCSNLPDLSSFDPDGTELDGAEIIIHNTTGSRMWNRERLTFRYALIRYTANSTTGGTCDVVALGKKS